MPRRDTAPTGAPCWIDLTTCDTQVSIEFYRRLFGWTADDPAEEFGGYVNFRHHDVRVAGCMARQPDSGAPDQWSVYLATDDATKTLEAVTATGGQVVVPAMAVGDLGTMAVVTDAGGAAVGLWQPGLHRGFGVLAEPVAPAWFELHTRDYDPTVGFYRDAFGWDTHVLSDTPEFRYTTLTHGEEWLAGVMDAAGVLAPEVPALLGRGSQLDPGGQGVRRAGERNGDDGLSVPVPPVGGHHQCRSQPPLLVTDGLTQVDQPQVATPRVSHRPGRRAPWSPTPRRRAAARRAPVGSPARTWPARRRPAPDRRPRRWWSRCWYRPAADTTRRTGRPSSAESGRLAEPESGPVGGCR